MTTGLRRGLRRFVDALQRGLFDEAAAAPSAPVAPAAPMPPPLGTRSGGPAASREIVLDGQRIAFRLVRVRRRSIGFVVDGTGLTVRAPHRIALRDIDDAVREKTRWILARLVDQRERAARLASARTVWRDGAAVPYLGRPLVVVLAGDREHGAGQTALAAPSPPDGDAQPQRLLVALPRDADETRIRDAVHSWLQREARRLFAERVAQFELRLGVRVARLGLSSAATRWGSANANGSVRLHWRLVEHPLATIDYVVAHELAHLREMNHGPRFWALVRSVVPDYEQSRARLRGQGRADL